MTLRDELAAMLDKARRYVASASLLRESGDYDSAVFERLFANVYH